MVYEPLTGNEYKASKDLRSWNRLITFPGAGFFDTKLLLGLIMSQVEYQVLRRSLCGLGCGCQIVGYAFSFNCVDEIETKYCSSCNIH